MQSFSVFSSGFFSSEFFVPQISQMTQIFFIGDFFHRISRNLFGGFLLRRLLTDFCGCDLSGRCRYPLRLEKVPQIYTDSGLVRSLEKNTQISQMTQFFCLDIWGIFLTIMARMNLCKSVESVGLLKRLTFSVFFNTLLPAFFNTLLPALFLPA